MANLEGLTVAILVEDGFEQVELVEPRKALDQAGAETRVVCRDRWRARAQRHHGGELGVAQRDAAQGLAQHIGERGEPEAQLVGAHGRR